MNVIKVGGNELDNPGFIHRLASIVKASAIPVVIVHGGGKAIDHLQERLGLEAQKVEGLRVTDESSLEVAQMVLSGSVNKEIVKTFLEQGVQAVGISGVDAALLRCKKKDFANVDLGFVGQITKVNTRFLNTLWEQGYTVVVSPISLGEDNRFYNVNADEAAGAIAAAVGAERVWFISNVGAVLDDEGRAIGKLYHRDALRLIERGTIRDGMIPKVRTALDVVAAGVPEAVIANIEGLSTGSGTRFLRSMI